MKIQESAENYLESILKIKKNSGQVRSIDVSRDLGFSKPSVSFAMKQFRENGYITMDEAGYISLTEEGYKIAERIYERHNVIAQFLMKIGVSEKSAYIDACKMEHDLCDESFECIKAFVKKKV